MEKHRDHIQKLETLLRMLDNDQVSLKSCRKICEWENFLISINLFRCKSVKCKRSEKRSTITSRTVRLVSYSPKQERM